MSSARLIILEPSVAPLINVALTASAWVAFGAFLFILSAVFCVALCWTSAEASDVHEIVLLDGEVRR